MDLVLSYFNGNMETTLASLVKLLELQDRFKLSVEEMCTWWSAIPQKIIDGHESSLFDRLFNLPEFVLLGGRYPKPDTKFTHPAFVENDSDSAKQDLHRLLAGLRVDDEQLYQLIVHLSTPLGLDINVENGTCERSCFFLSIENLSLLYRHAQLAHCLDITIPRLFQLIAQQQELDSGYIEGLDGITAFLKYYDWQRATDYSIDDISYLLGNQPVDPAAYPDPGILAEQTRDEIRKDGALTFADTVFAYLDNVTDEQSRFIVETNSGWIEKLRDGDRYELSRYFFDAQQFESDPREGLTFLRTLFSYIEGISEDQSIRIIEENHALFEQIEIPNPYARPPILAARLTESFDQNSVLNIPEGIKVNEAEIRSLLSAYYNVRQGVYSLLINYHTTEVFPLYLSRHLNLSIGKTKSLIKMTGVDLADPDFVAYLQDAEQLSENVVEFIGKLLRLSVLFKKDLFDPNTLDFVDRQKHEIFNIDDLNSLNPESVADTTPRPIFSVT